MLVVFEGPDGAGKSLLAERVQKRLNAMRIHCGPPQATHAFDHWLAAVNLVNFDVPALRNNSIVFDRLHWGDAIYAQRYRPEVGPQLSRAQMHAIDENIVIQGGIVVHVTATVEKLTSRFDGEYINKADIYSLWDEYWDLAYNFEDRFPTHLFHVDTTFDPPVDTYAEIVVDLATRRRKEVL